MLKYIGSLSKGVKWDFIFKCFSKGRKWNFINIDTRLRRSFSNPSSNSDKNRSSTYNFTFKDYIDRSPLKFPDGYDDFGKLPEGYCALMEPDDDTPPTVWMINVTGMQLVEVEVLFWIFRTNNIPFLSPIQNF